MALTDQAHVDLAGQRYALDHSLVEFGRWSFRRWSRSVLSEGIGEPRDLRPEVLVWKVRDFSGGEGQVVFDPEVEGSKRRFYRSEGLDFRVPGHCLAAFSNNSPTRSMSRFLGILGIVRPGS